MPSTQKRRQDDHEFWGSLGKFRSSWSLCLCVCLSVCISFCHTYTQSRLLKDLLWHIFHGKTIWRQSTLKLEGQRTQGVRLARCYLRDHFQIPAHLPYAVTDYTCVLPCSVYVVIGIESKASCMPEKPSDNGAISPALVCNYFMCCVRWSFCVSFSQPWEKRVHLENKKNTRAYPMLLESRSSCFSNVCRILLSRSQCHNVCRILFSRSQGHSQT